MIIVSFYQHISRRYIYKLLSFLLIFIMILSCSTTKPVNQGITGQVLWYEGNLMPGIDKPPAKGKPVVRELYFYAPTHISQVSENSQVFYSGIQTELIRKIETDEEGKFEVRLDPGTYSVFVKEPDGLFANRYNEYGMINPVRVSPGQVTEIEIRVDYKAAY